MSLTSSIETGVGGKLIIWNGSSSTPLDVGEWRLKRMPHIVPCAHSGSGGVQMRKRVSTDYMVLAHAPYVPGALTDPQILLAGDDGNFTDVSLARSNGSTYRGKMLLESCELVYKSDGDPSGDVARWEIVLRCAEANVITTTTVNGVVINSGVALTPTLVNGL